ncbi:hypothetical protein EDD22DRAFT_1016266 [Suillus occidentalis]|nr:hypothetical protein EDD22DRAFT_1016266 [Suillus occidentalis]
MVVEVLTTQVSVTSSGLHLEDTLLITLALIAATPELVISTTVVEADTVEEDAAGGNGVTKASISAFMLPGAVNITFPAPNAVPPPPSVHGCDWVCVWEWEGTWGAENGLGSGHKRPRKSEVKLERIVKQTTIQMVTVQVSPTKGVPLQLGGLWSRSSTEEPLNLANRTKFFHDNVVVIKVDNLLAGWPTYTLDFIPEHPGPLDVSNFRSTKDNNSEDEAEGTGKVKHKVESESPPVIEDDADVTMVCKATSKDAPLCLTVKPVQLYGTPKDPPSIILLWMKFEQENGYTWPPRHGFRKMSAEVPLNHVDAFMTLPAAVAALKLE